MVKRKKVLSSLLAICLMLFTLMAVAGCSSGTKAEAPAGEQQTGQSAGQSDKVITLRLGHAVTTTHSSHLSAQHFADLVAEKTNGKVRIEIYPGGQLGGERDMLEMVQNGSLDMAQLTASIHSGFTNVFLGFQLPWLIEDMETLEKVLTNKEITQPLLDGLSEIGIKGLCIYDVGFRHFIFNNGFILTPKDLAGKKMRATQNPLVVKMFDLLKANITTIPYGEIYSSLQTKVINGLEMDLAGLYSEKHYEVAPYITLSNHYSFPTVMEMNLDKWNSLPPEYQKAIQEAADESVLYNIQKFKEYEAKALEGIKKAGAQIKEIPDLTPFKEAVQPVYDEYENIDPRVSEFVKAVRALKHQ